MRANTAWENYKGFERYIFFYFLNSGIFRELSPGLIFLVFQKLTPNMSDFRLATVFDGSVWFRPAQRADQRPPARRCDTNYTDKIFHLAICVKNYQRLMNTWNITGEKYLKHEIYNGNLRVCTKGEEGTNYIMLFCLLVNCLTSCVAKCMGIEDSH